MRGLGAAHESFVEASAGLTAGLAATLVAHPLELVKTRLQVNRNTNALELGNSLRIFRSILAKEGGFRALYRGLPPNIVGNSAGWALYFLCYDQAKKAASTIRDEAELSYWDFFVASGSAGVFTTICTNPIWVIKTRMLSTSYSFDGAYYSMYDGLRQIYRSEGLRGFYRGLVPSLFGVSHGALQFTIYEKLKISRKNHKSSENAPLSNLDYLSLSGLSKLIAGAVTYPYQVVRSRLQTYEAQRTYRGVFDVMAQVSRQEGVKGFYKGLVPNTLRILPSTCVTFVVYENMKNVLLSKYI